MSLFRRRQGCTLVLYAEPLSQGLVTAFYGGLTSVTRNEVDTYFEAANLNNPP
jgi:hypothetical protein